MDNVIDKLKALVNYYDSNRQVGHTSRVFKGVDNNTIVVAHSHQSSKMLGKQYEHEKFLNVNNLIHGLDWYRGCYHPIVFDNTALYVLFKEILSEFDNFRTKLTGVHIFGMYNQWAISEDDGCLRFHPQYNEHPEVTSTHIWREAFEEVQKLGGYVNVVEMLRKYRTNN